MTICINDNLWDKGERSEIINAAVNIHLEKRRKTMDQEKESEVKKKKMLVEFTIVESKSEDKSESEEESKSEDENGFSEDSEGLFQLLSLETFFLFSVQLQVFYIQSSIFFSFMNEMDNMVLPYRVQIRLLGYLQYLIGASGKIVWKRSEPN